MKEMIIQVSNNNKFQELALKKEIQEILTHTPDILSYSITETVEGNEYWWNVGLFVSNVFSVWSRLKPVLENDEKLQKKSEEKVVLVLLKGIDGWNDYEMLFCNPQEEMTSQEEIERTHGFRRH